MASAPDDRFRGRAAEGHGRSYLRLRLVSAIMVVAIVVIIAIPGDFPVWLKIEQGVCGLLLLGVVLLSMASTCGRSSPPGNVEGAEYGRWRA